MTKYFAKKTPCQHGHCHDSKREAARCNELHLLQMGREIEGVCIGRKFEFHVNGAPVMMRNGQVAKYTPDFTYSERGKLVAEDVKSDPTTTEAFALRAALFRHLYPEWELRLVK